MFPAMTIHWRWNDMGKATASDHPATGKRPRGIFGRFTRNAKGSVAIEFAALAIPFSMLVFAVIESSISFAAQQVLTNIADDVARKFRTGQERAATLNADQLETDICRALEIVVTKDCPGLEIDLRRHDTFAQAAATKIKYTATGDLDTTDFKIELGQSSSKNQLRLFYRWPVMTDFLRKSMSNLPNGNTLHYATVTWQNEPFED